MKTSYVCQSCGIRHGNRTGILLIPVGDEYVCEKCVVERQRGANMKPDTDGLPGRPYTPLMAGKQRVVRYTPKP